MGNDVLCVDIDEDKIAALSRGEILIFEPGLSQIVEANYERGTLKFISNIEKGIDFGDIIFIAVGTPEDGDGSADLTYALDVARSIRTHMQVQKVVVDKSTVPVGTADRVAGQIRQALDERGEKLPFHVVSNPEFLNEGAAVSDFMKPDRIVIGSNSEHAVKSMNQLYAPFNRNHDKIFHMDTRSAEMTKYAANVMLATRISLMNELANIADRLGADIEDVRRGIGMDPRIGYHFIYAGAGYGGSCFPKDVKALIHTAQQANYEATILEGVDAVNDLQKSVLIEKLYQHFGTDVKGMTIGLWGLAFKPNTDDMREAPSVTLIDELTAAGAKVVAYDPEANAAALRLYAGNDLFTVVDDRQAVLAGADALVVMTEWNEFCSPDFNRLKEAMKTPVVFDGRNLYEPNYLRQLGITHYGIGRGGDLPMS
jgi:UDPglucose 6-dehydrogenase